MANLKCALLVEVLITCTSFYQNPHSKFLSTDELANETTRQPLKEAWPGRHARLMGQRTRHHNVKRSVANSEQQLHLRRHARHHNSRGNATSSELKQQYLVRDTRHYNTKGNTTSGELKQQYRQLQYELQVPSGSVVTNKVVLAIFELFLFGLCGLDRCYMGQNCLGLVKGLTGGGFIVWAFVDAMAVLFNCFMKSPSINSLGFTATFELNTINTAFWLAIVWFAATVCLCFSRSTTQLLDAASAWYGLSTLPPIDPAKIAKRQSRPAKSIVQAGSESEPVANAAPNREKSTTLDNQQNEIDPKSKPVLGEMPSTDQEHISRPPPHRPTSSDNDSFDSSESEEEVVDATEDDNVVKPPIVHVVSWLGRRASAMLPLQHPNSSNRANSAARRASV